MPSKNKAPDPDYQPLQAEAGYRMYANDVKRACTTWLRNHEDSRLCHRDYFGRPRKGVDPNPTPE